MVSPKLEGKILLEKRLFDRPEDLAKSLAEQVANELMLEIIAKGTASLAVSGGSTPRLFFQYLSQADIDWQYVTITLVDERYVPPTSERSNEGLLKRYLLRGSAQQAKFLGLYNTAITPELAAFTASSRLNRISRPFTAVILGMGEDGHTASFFKGADRLSQALDPKGKALILPMRVPAVPEARLTMTLPLLVSAGFLALHIEGYKKLLVLDQVLKEKNDLACVFPIQAVLREASNKVKLYWSPNEKELIAENPEEPLLTGLLPSFAARLEAKIDEG